MKGLHRHYDNDLRAEVEGGRVELTLRLAPHEVEALQRCEGEGATLRSIFRLRSTCGEFRAILQSIERYDPTNEYLCCTFLRIDR